MAQKSLFGRPVEPEPEPPAAGGFKLSIVKKDGKWWVAGNPDPSCPDEGPHDTQEEAFESMQSSQRFWDRWFAEGWEERFQKGQL